jgi:hypothetical protein
LPQLGRLRPHLFNVTVKELRGLLDRRTVCDVVRMRAKSIGDQARPALTFGDAAFKVLPELCLASSSVRARSQNPWPHRQGVFAQIESAPGPQRRFAATRQNVDNGG